MAKNNENNENNDNIKNKLEDNYKFLIELGSGSFGSVWRVIERKTNKEYAVKIEDKNSKSRLKNEYKIYKKLRDYGVSFGIPRVKCYFESSKKCYLLMQLLGKSLDQVLNDLPAPFDLATVLKLGIQITKLLEIIHSAGFIHRDIKPNNFLIGTGEDANCVFIMDFGLSKKYIIDDEHIKMRIERSLVGTARYASINVHQGFEPSRRDDLESVGYMLVYFLLKRLPWQGLNKKKKNCDHIKLIGECKMKTSLNDLCENLPHCFKEYIKYCRSLKFDEKPDYAYLKNLFYKTADEKQLDLRYLWEEENVY
jgi:serine/threonine protein kinase